MKLAIVFRRMVRRYGIQTVLILGAVVVLLLLHRNGTLPLVKVQRQFAPIPTRSAYTADMLITNATVVTMDAQRDIFDHGWIVVRDGAIAQVGSGSAPKIRAREVIDAGGKIAIPGLINTHSHTAMTLLRGVDDGNGFNAWLSDVGSYEQRFTPDDVYWGSLLGEIEMVQSGTTTFNDMYFDTESTAKAVEQVGMRALLRIPITTDTSRVFVDQQSLANHVHTSRIGYTLAPNPVTAYSSDQLQALGQWAGENSVPFHLHMESDSTENAQYLKTYGKLPLAVLQSTGLIDQRLILAHAEYFSDKELQELAKHPLVGVSFNPKSDYKLTGATAPVARMLELGIPVALGTDGAASTNTLDMFDHMNFSAFTAGKCSNISAFCKNGYTIDPQAFFTMATIGGAKVLGLDSSVGSLEVGKRADIVLVDATAPRTTPQYDVYSTLVYTAHGTDVSDVVIDGKVILRNKKILTVNVDEVQAKVNAIAERIKKEEK